LPRPWFTVRYPLVILGRDVKQLTALHGNAMRNIDAEYEALCAEYEGALV